MADPAQTASTNSLANQQIAQIRDNPFIRQAALMIGIAASVALGVAVVLWSRTPSYEPLFTNIAEQDAMAVIDALKQLEVEYKLDDKSGSILVPAGRQKEIRMKLAGQGLPQGGGLGFEMLNQDTGFGTSRLVEKARYHHALEGELARTIATISSVQSARVHLALPKQSVFVRKRKAPSASVIVKLFAGRALEKPQVEAIVHLVASSVPDLETGRVTIVDQKGRMLSDERSTEEMKLSSSQFEYARNLEDHFQRRIEDLLAPIVGLDKVRAQVSADVDFTVTERTQEQFNPDQPALRSEQVAEELNRSGIAQGVPGALTNQPPAAAAAPEQAAGAPTGGVGSQPTSTSKQATRNYEIDRVISHTRQAPAALRRLSVAVVVDDRTTVGPDGAVTRLERSPEELERITQLVREAIGFSVQRGDSIKVINSRFQTLDSPEVPPEPAIWEQSWFLDLAKQLGAVLVVLLLVLFVLRPTMKRLTAHPADEVLAEGERVVEKELLAADDEEQEAGGLVLDRDEEFIKLPGPAEYESLLDAARQLVDEDPKRVVQLMKTWVEEDAA